MEQRELASFEQLVKDIFSTLERDNKRIMIKKHYGRSIALLIGLVPR